MIGDLVVVLAIVVGAGGLGLWLGIVILAPRLQRRIDRAEEAAGIEAARATPAEEPDGRAD